MAIAYINDKTLCKMLYYIAPYLTIIFEGAFSGTRDMLALAQWHNYYPVKWQEQDKECKVFGVHFANPGRSLMQPSISIWKSPSLRVVKDLTLSRRQILRCLNFGICGLSPNLFLHMVNLHLIIYKGWWILNEHALYCFIMFWTQQWILAREKKLSGWIFLQFYFLSK